MATHHASTGDILAIRPLGAPRDDTQSSTLLRDEHSRSCDSFCELARSCLDDPQDAQLKSRSRSNGAHAGNAC